jgi:hypothetical protein
MSPISEYLQALHQVRSSRAGVGERSYYPALQGLLNAVGATLKPKVVCVHELADSGAGNPDYGLFTATQLSLDESAGVRALRPPDRGVIEAKSPATDVVQIVDSPQVARYWEHYALVLVTNFRSFVVIGRDEFGRRITRERFDLVDSERGLWELAAVPARLGRETLLRFREFLTRLLLHNASLTQPRDVAAILASFARDARARLELAGAQDRRRTLLDGHDFGTLLNRLDSVRETLEAVLGIRFDTDRGQHFFRSTLVQTLFYGLFSAWVIWARSDPDRTRRGPFSPDRVPWLLRVKVVRALFEQVYRPGALEGLGLTEVLDWAADVLRRVDDRAFFSRFRDDHAVQYFYEPFLEAYDPDLRKSLGVWYTPPEVVDYMVGRVDWALRTRLDLPRGLADERVRVLDPCCGTGSFILAVLRRIARTLADEGEAALAGPAVKRAAVDRIRGFEIMPAPLVIAHLQVAMALDQEYAAPLRLSDGHTARPDEFPGIFLTNALTGLDDSAVQQPILPLPELSIDGENASRVKREEEILVVIGNPPYNGFAGVGDTEEERRLTDPWRRVRRVRPPEGQGLNDLYVRFWRMAERRIAERSGRGVICLITNYSWLDGLSFTGMRERFLDAFDGIWIDCLNGDKFKTGKRTPDGRPDPSIFSSVHNREGIGVGTAIALCVRQGAVPVLPAAPPPPPVVLPPVAAPLQFPPDFDGRPESGRQLCQRRWRHRGLPVPGAGGTGAEGTAGGAGRRILRQDSAVLTRFRFLFDNHRQRIWDRWHRLHPAAAPGLETLPVEPPDSQPVSRPVPQPAPPAEPVAAPPGHRATVFFRHLWGPDKPQQLGRSQDHDGIQEYEILQPSLPMGLPLTPGRAAAGWFDWPALLDLMPVSLPGVKTSRDDFVIDIDRERLTKRIQGYLSGEIADDELAALYPGIMQKVGQHHPKEARRLLLAQGFQESQIVRYAYRPFDQRWLYWEKGGNLLDRPRGEFATVLSPENPMLEVRAKQPKEHFDRGYLTTHLPDNFGNGLSSFFPLQADTGTGSRRALFNQAEGPRRAANLSETALALLSRLSLDRECIFFHAAALLNTPAYRQDHQVTLRQDWPRLPLPESALLLAASARLGRQVAALLDPDQALPGVTTGGAGTALRPLLALVGQPHSLRMDGQLNRRLQARWGSRGQGSTCMPGPGDARRRDWSAAEREAITAEATRLDSRPADLTALLGGGCVDVHLNDETCWTAVPAAVWGHTISGYPVLKKWLSYREHALLGRDLTDDELRHFRDTVRRLTALILLGPQLDANYRACAGMAG